MVNPRKPVAMMKLQGKIDSAVKIQAQLKVRLFEVLVWYDAQWLFGLKKYSFYY